MKLKEAMKRAWKAKVQVLVLVWLLVISLNVPMQAKGIFSGTTTDTFSPKGTMTRAM